MRKFSHVPRGGRGKGKMGILLAEMGGGKEKDIITWLVYWVGCRTTSRKKRNNILCSAQIRRGGKI